jgi:hypothetical protein
MIINGYYVSPMGLLIGVVLIAFSIFLLMLYTDGVRNSGGTITGKLFENEDDGDDDDEVEYEGDW